MCNIGPDISVSWILAIPYAGTVGKGIMKSEKLNILDIILEKKDNSVSYNLNKEELSKLLFKKMKIDHKKVAKIDTSAFRSIHVEFIPGVELELCADLPRLYRI